MRRKAGCPPEKRIAVGEFDPSFGQLLVRVQMPMCPIIWWNIFLWMTPDRENILGRRDVVTDRKVELRRDRNMIPASDFFFGCCSSIRPHISETTAKATLHSQALS
jgi:hypothetical protein